MYYHYHTICNPCIIIIAQSVIHVLSLSHNHKRQYIWFFVSVLLQTIHVILYSHGHLNDLRTWTQTSDQMKCTEMFWVSVYVSLQFRCGRHDTFGVFCECIVITPNNTSWYLRYSHISMTAISWRILTNADVCKRWQLLLHTNSCIQAVHILLAKNLHTLAY